MQSPDSLASLGAPAAQQLPAAWLQRAGLRTHRHVAHIGRLRKPRSTLHRALAALGKAAGVATLGLPLAGAAALVVAGRDDAEAVELVRSLPRTARVVGWGAWATWQYKALAAAHGGDAKSDAYQLALTELHDRAATRLLLLLQACGGVYIKAGQLAVSLNAVPPQYRSILAALQDRVPSRPFPDIDCVLQRELGAHADALFDGFERQATAAASLAQVHKAWLPDGTAVAVKVQYPGLAATVSADVATMLVLSDVAHWLFPATRWRWLFEELQGQIEHELDFRNEAANATRLAECMAGRQDVTAPRIFPELCTRRVLTMEWVDGCKLSDVEGMLQAGLEPRQVGILLLDAMAQSTYYDAWVHGDPHPGNILVRPRPDPPPLLSRLLLGARPRPQLVFLDHGIYVTMPDRLRHLYCQLWCAIVLGDMDTARVAATELGGERAGRILPEVLRPRNWAQVPIEERRRVREQSGINSFADLANLLEEAPKQLLDSLRQSAVVRHSATQLGATLSDRLRVNVTWAVRGLYRSADGGPPQFVGGLQSRLRRWRLALQVQALRLAFWLASALHQVATALVPQIA
ncbi:putative aarF domain-containing kinase 1 [Micractinium conductrix]|uniref:AarF domain-containing kinase 1 n=1 Tax=Micractinium conductrix TaxID=554055 RepID=A0A2P6VBX0_9CHLO|nr:putative aarF domain-containing kinase 1 [Micractinium conductrix]|eukprot:PSC71592.1 putative aarF domain-containing kinase 1 [Micractinium conductrix]